MVCHRSRIKYSANRQTKTPRQPNKKSAIKYSLATIIYEDFYVRFRYNDFSNMARSLTWENRPFTKVHERTIKL